jgi:hypothetical protein
MKDRAINLQPICRRCNSRRNHDKCSHHRSAFFQRTRRALRGSHVYRRNAGQLWRVTGDLCVESELVDHGDSELSEDGNGCFDRYGMLARHMSPAETKSQSLVQLGIACDMEGERSPTSQ